MATEDLARMSAVALARAVRLKQLSPVEIMERVLQRIAEVEPSLNAFAALCSDEAVRAARDHETKLMRRETLGPLHGVPFTVKDLVATKHVKTEFGSRLRKDFVAGYDAPAVTRLEQAGAMQVASRLVANPCDDRLKLYVVSTMLLGMSTRAL